MKKILKNMVFGLFLLLLFLPVLQKGLDLVTEQPLHGAFVPANMPDFTWKRWFSGEFQEKFDRFIEEHIGFRNSLVRLTNQLDFSLFREANAEGVVIGKKDFLYEYDYIRDYTGQDFTGMEFIRKKMMRAAYLQKLLKDSLDIDFIIVFEPGKATFYPEYIPGAYLRKKNETTNYLAYREVADELGVKYIDFNDYFLKLKDTASHPLYPRYGTHWSVYGMSIAADLLIDCIEDVRQEKLRDVRVARYELAREPRDTDNDVEKPLNLMCSLPSEEFAYPVWDIDTVSDRYRPLVLAVADSYYWNFFNTRIPKHLFGNEAFWYFNARVYPDTYFNEKLVKDLDLRNEIEKKDVIFLMVTERFLHKFDWQFIDMVYSLYTPDWLADPVYENMNRVINFDPWFNRMVEKSRNENVPLGEELRKEGLFLYFTEKKGAYLSEHGVEYHMDIIRGDRAWFGDIGKKATENGVPVEEQLRADAIYIFSQNYPEQYQAYLGIREIIHEMESDIGALDSLSLLAATYGCTLEGFIEKKAFAAYREREIANTMDAIRNTPEWLANVQAKASEKNITLDEMIRLDAEYVWEQRMK